MSSQAEAAAQILLKLYIEHDQRSGWTDLKSVHPAMTKEGLSLGRVESGLALLRSYEMIEARKTDSDVEQVKISGYGVDWIDKNLPPEFDGKTYTFQGPIFGSVKLTDRASFYRVKKRRTSGSMESPNWTKVGVIVAIMVGIITIAIMKGWL